MEYVLISCIDCGDMAHYYATKDQLQEWDYYCGRCAKFMHVVGIKSERLHGHPDPPNINTMPHIHIRR